MSQDGWTFGDPCIECGEETSAEHRRYCDDCYREQQGWREPRPNPGAPPESFVVALAGIRRELKEIHERLERLEQQGTWRRSRGAA